MEPGFRILVVDDEYLIRWTLKTALSKEGYLVDIAEDGSQAMELMKTVPVDLVITDLAMPGKNGWDVIEESRKRKAMSIMITGRGDHKIKTIAENKGAYAYIEKPFKVAELMDIVKGAMGLSAEKGKRQKAKGERLCARPE